MAPCFAGAANAGLIPKESDLQENAALAIRAVISSIASSRDDSSGGYGGLGLSGASTRWRPLPEAVRLAAGLNQADQGAEQIAMRGADTGGFNGTETSRRSRRRAFTPDGKTTLQARAAFNRRSIMANCYCEHHFSSTWAKTLLTAIIGTRIVLTCLVAVLQSNP